MLLQPPVHQDQLNLHITWLTWLHQVCLHWKDHPELHPTSFYFQEFFYALVILFISKEVQSLLIAFETIFFESIHIFSLLFFEFTQSFDDLDILTNQELYFFHNELNNELILSLRQFKIRKQFYQALNFNTENSFIFLNLN